MKVILSYLENMFFNMPDTPEVNKAKEELASMMEDKYNELLAEGKKENEAVGIVISEFGDLEELKEELGLNFVKEEANVYSESVRLINKKEADAYMEDSVKSSKWIAAGVMLCIYSPIFLFFCGSMEEIRDLSDAVIMIFGVVPLFIMIAIAVGIFIFQGMKMEKYEFMKKEMIRIDQNLEKYLNHIAEMEKPKATVKMIIGVIMCIFAVVPLLISGAVFENTYIHGLFLIVMLLIIGIAVAVMIMGESRLECIKVLKQEGEFTHRRKKETKLIDIVAGVYWPVATAIYLIWSITTMNWGVTWILWPIAGVIFWAIASVCEAIVK